MRVTAFHADTVDPFDLEFVYSPVVIALGMLSEKTHLGGIVEVKTVHENVALQIFRSNP